VGLDSVELAMAIEEEFGIDIADRDLGKMITVGDVYNYLVKHLSKTTTRQCLTQKVFYQLRRAVMANYGLDRRSITPDTKLSDFLTDSEIAEGWPWMQGFIGLQTPDFRYRPLFIGFHLPPKVRTMKQLVRSLIELNSRALPPEREGDDVEIWHRLVAVFVRQLNVNIEEVVPEASITKDLGCD